MTEEELRIFRDQADALIGQRVAGDVYGTIVETVIEHFRISLEDIYCRRKFERHTWPRQIAMFFCREFSEMSLNEIGRQFCPEDPFHNGTVLSAIQKVRDLPRDRRKAAVMAIREKLKVKLKEAV